MEGPNRDSRPILSVEALEDRTLLSSSALPNSVSVLTSFVATSSYAAVRSLATEVNWRELLSFNAAAAAVVRALNAEVHVPDPDHDALLDALYDHSGEERRTLMAVLNLPDATESRSEALAEGEARAPLSSEGTAAGTAPGPHGPKQTAEPLGVAGTTSRSDESEEIPAPVAPPVVGQASEEQQPQSPTPSALPLDVPAAIALAPKAAALLEGGLPVDLPAIKQNVDDFFARLADTVAPRDGVRWVRFAPWLIVAAAGAFEIARRWERRIVRRTVLGDEIVPKPNGPLSDDE